MNHNKVGMLPKPPSYTTQDQWEELHRANERNARLAAKCDSLVSSVHDRLEREFGDVTTLQMLVAQIPRVNEQIKQIMQQLGKEQKLLICEYDVFTVKKPS